jgi:predicted ATP-dependent endonuclease of OLD family
VGYNGGNNSRRVMMAKGKAFVVVGHNNWGKSQTLRALTDGNWHIKWTTIGGKDFKVKRMSNDDLPADHLVNFLTEIDKKDIPFIIITLCPAFGKKDRKTEKILKLLCAKYRAFFWVMKRKADTSEEIDNADIRKLRQFGKVEVFRDNAEPDVRARRFKRFIKENL